MISYFNLKWNTFKNLFNSYSPLCYVTFYCKPCNSFKRIWPQKIDKSCSENLKSTFFFLTTLTAQTAHTEKLRIQNVAYWPTVNRTWIVGSRCNLWMAPNAFKALEFQHAPPHCIQMKVHTYKRVKLELIFSKQINFEFCTLLCPIHVVVKIWYHIW